MAIEIAGGIAYELIYKDDPPLTDAQTEALAAEYEKLGLHYMRSTWEGCNCLIIKAPAAAYKPFGDKKSTQWKSIRERVGYDGLLIARSNAYLPGQTFFSPGNDWPNIVEFIDANFQHKAQAKRWKWQFWK